MSELILIRHGQATPFEADTDRLSPLGETQARVVGAALRGAGWTPTHVQHGPLVRQRRTALLAAGADWPEPTWPAPTEAPGLAEYDGDGLTGVLSPLLAERDDTFAALTRDFRAQRGGPDRNRSFQKLLELLAAHWQAGTVTHPDVEPWSAFRARVEAALAELLALPPGSRVAVFTSGGVIGLMVALVLRAPDSAALSLNWRVRNASLTRLTFSGERVSLDSFNEVHHLTPAQQSWR